MVLLTLTAFGGSVLSVRSGAWLPPPFVGVTRFVTGPCLGHLASSTEPCRVVTASLAFFFFLNSAVNVDGEALAAMDLAKALRWSCG